MYIEVKAERDEDGKEEEGKMKEERKIQLTKKQSRDGRRPYQHEQHWSHPACIQYHVHQYRDGAVVCKVDHTYVSLSVDGMYITLRPMSRGSSITSRDSRRAPARPSSSPSIPDGSERGASSDNRSSSAKSILGHSGTRYEYGGINDSSGVADLVKKARGR
jgi:hypothetical protein